MVAMQWWQLGLMLGLMLVVWIILRSQKVNQDALFLIATLRMTIQLIVMGYVLIWIFDTDSAIVTVVAMLVMQAYAMSTLIKRTGLSWRNLDGKVAIGSIFVGTVCVQIYFAFVLFGEVQLVNAQHHIPILGMLLSNALTAIILGIKTLQQGLTHQYHQIETLLMLGATRKQALQPLIRASFEAALVPTFNSMLTMGIVALPGMMTGQILAGISPIDAIMYQIAIMCAICATTAITLALFFICSQWFLFDRYHTLKKQQIRPKGSDAHA